MARTLLFSGTLQWPLEDGGQAAKLALSVSLVYTSMAAIEKVYSAPVIDEALTLPMASAKFVLLKASGEDIDVKLNGAATAVTLKAGGGFLLVQNDDGAITGIEVSAATAPATLEGYMFA